MSSILSGLFKEGVSWAQRILPAAFASGHNDFSGRSYVHVPMAQPVIIKSPADTKLIAGTDNLQYCSFIAVQSDSYLGFMHFNGTDESRKQLNDLADFFAEVSGEKKDSISVTTAQNISSFISDGGIKDRAHEVWNSVYNTFAERGIKKVSLPDFGNSSCFIYCQGEMKMRPQSSGLREQFPNCFIDSSLQYSAMEHATDSYLVPEIADTRQKFWGDFSSAKSPEDRLRVIEESSPLIAEQAKSSARVIESEKRPEAAESFVARLLSSQENTSSKLIG